MKSIREQQEERRQAKLRHMRTQIKSGTLLVRQMTPGERDGDPVFPRKKESAGSPDGA